MTDDADRLVAIAEKQIEALTELFAEESKSEFSSIPRFFPVLIQVQFDSAYLHPFHAFVC
jgi:hypothetical protein